MRKLGSTTSSTRVFYSRNFFAASSSQSAFKIGLKKCNFMNFVFLLNDKFFFFMYVNLTYEGFINVSRSINKCNLEVDIYELHPLNLIAPLAKIPYYIALFFHILSTMHLFCLLKDKHATSLLLRLLT